MGWSGGGGGGASFPNPNSVACLVLCQCDICFTYCPPKSSSAASSSLTTQLCSNTSSAVNRSLGSLTSNILIKSFASSLISSQKGEGNEYWPFLIKWYKFFILLLASKKGGNPYKSV